MMQNTSLGLGSSIRFRRAVIAALALMVSIGVLTYVRATITSAEKFQELQLIVDQDPNIENQLVACTDLEHIIMKNGRLAVCLATPADPNIMLYYPAAALPLYNADRDPNKGYVLGDPNAKWKGGEFSQYVNITDPNGTPASGAGATGLATLRVEGEASNSDPNQSGVIIYSGMIATLAPDTIGVIRPTRANCPTIDGCVSVGTQNFPFRDFHFTNQVTGAGTGPSLSLTADGSGITSSFSTLQSTIRQYSHGISPATGGGWVSDTWPGIDNSYSLGVSTAAGDAVNRRWEALNVVDIFASGDLDLDGTIVDGTIDPNIVITCLNDGTTTVCLSNSGGNQILTGDTGNLRINPSGGNIGISVAPDAIGTLSVGGALQVGLDPNSFGFQSDYTSLVLNDTVGQGAGYFVKTTGVPVPMVALTAFDDASTVRRLYFGGGGWGISDATDIRFFTDPNYTDADVIDDGLLRLEIDPNGAFLFGANDASDFIELNPAGTSGTHNIGNLRGKASTQPGRWDAYYGWDADVYRTLEHGNAPSGVTLGFNGVTPVAQPASTTDIKDALADTSGYGLLADSGASPLDLDGGAARVGDLDLDTGATINPDDNELIAVIGGKNIYQGGIIFSQTAQNIVTNTAAETSIIGSGVDDMVLDPNYFEEGRTLRFFASGQFDHAAAGNFDLKIKLGSTALITDNTTPGVTSGAWWWMHGRIVCRSVGATGTLMAWLEIGSSGGIAGGQRDNFSAGTAIDTTASQTFDITITESAASASNSFETEMFYLEVLR